MSMQGYVPDNVLAPYEDGWINHVINNGTDAALLTTACMTTTSMWYNYEINMHEITGADGLPT